MGLCASAKSKKNLFDTLDLSNGERKNVMTKIQKNPLHMSMQDLCEHIVKQHHQFVRQEGPEILKAAQHLEAKNKADFYTIKTLLSEILSDLSPHMLKEEMVLFPFCKKLEQAEDIFEMPFGSIARPIEVMSSEHNKSSRDLNVLESLLSKTHEENQNYTTWIERIQAFCQDLKTHMYLENEVLFPRALALEEAFNMKFQREG